MSVVELNRHAFWVEYGSSTSRGFSGANLPRLLTLVVRLLQRATEARLPLALEDGIAALLRFVEDEEPRREMQSQQLLPVITRLVQSAQLISTPAARESGKLLLAQLNGTAADDGEETTPPPGNFTARDSLTELAIESGMCNDPELVVALKASDWDAFLTILRRIDDIAHQLGAAVMMSAPLDVIQYLVLERQADVNALMLSTPLCTPLMRALEVGDVDLAMFLLDDGADIRFQVEYGYSPLIRSCMRSDLLPVTHRLVAELSSSDLAYRSFNVLDNISGTALGMCVGYAKDDVTIDSTVEQARVLLEAGAPVDQRMGMYNSLTPLMVVLRQEKVPLIRLLAEHGADLSEVELFALSLFDRMRLERRKKKPVAEELVMCLLDLFVKHDETVKGDEDTSLVSSPALFRAFYCQPECYYFPRVTRRWVELGASVGLALEEAVSKGRLADVELFLQVGADPNFRAGGDASSSPLLAAIALKNKPESVKIATVLIQAGADLGSMAGRGGVLQAARLCGNSEAVALLKRAGAAEDARRTSPPQRQQHLTDVFDEDIKFHFQMCACCRSRPAQLRPCSACKMVAYCGQACQMKHWEAHKAVCKTKQNMAKSRKAAANA